MIEPEATTQPCQLHKYHYPKPRVNHIHHVWPLGEGGPDVAGNRIVVCPTGHDNIHNLLRGFKAFLGEPPATVLAMYTRSERATARLGWDRMQRRAL